MPLRKLILDTNVCGKLLTPDYSTEIAQIRKRINREYRVVVSPETLLELLDAIKGGDGTHFEADRQRLLLMIGTREAVFLPFPGAFVLNKTLGLTSTVSKFHPNHFRKWVNIVLLAKSREELFNGGVRLPLDRKRKTWGFDPEIIRNQQKAGKAQHRSLMESVRDRKRTLPPCDLWAAGVAHVLGHKVNHEQAIKLANALDAAYRHDAELCSVVANGKYNFENMRAIGLITSSCFIFAIRTSISSPMTALSRPRYGRVLSGTEYSICANF